MDHPVRSPLFLSLIAAATVVDPEQHPGQLPALTLGRGNILTAVRCLRVPPLTHLPSWGKK